MPDEARIEELLKEVTLNSLAPNRGLTIRDALSTAMQEAREADAQIALEHACGHSTPIAIEACNSIRRAILAQLPPTTTPKDDKEKQG